MRRKHAIRAALAVWEELDGRSGFELGSLRYDDRDIFVEIITRLADIIQAEGLPVKERR